MKCSYCQNEIDRRYDFCTGCGTSYRPINKILDRPPPPILPPLDRRIMIFAKPGITLFVLLGVGIVALSIVGHLCFGPENLQYTFYLESGFVIALTSFFAIAYWRDLSECFQFKAISLSVLSAGLLMLFILLALNIGYHELLRHLLKVEESPSIGDSLREMGISTVGSIFLICVQPAIFEEIAFRGLLQEWLSRCMNEWKTYFAVAFLFMLLHFAILSMPYLFLVGLFLCWVRRKTGSLYLPIAFHFIHNFSVLLYYDIWSGK